MGGTAGQHAAGRAAPVARAGGGGRAVDVGGSVARPALGAALEHLCGREGDFALFSLGRHPKGGPAVRAEQLGRAAARPARQRAHDRPRDPSRARHRQVAQVHRDDGHGRHPLGGGAGAVRLDRRGGRRRSRRRAARARPPLPPHLRAGARPTDSPVGPGSRGDRRPTRSPRSRPRCCPSDAARRRVAARRGRAGHARRQTAAAPGAPAAERRCLLPARRSRAGAARATCGSAGAALDVARLAGRAPRRRRDPRNLEAVAAHRADRGLGPPLASDARRGRGRGRLLPLPGLDRRIEVVWSA